LIKLQTCKHNVHWIVAIQTLMMETYWTHVMHIW